MRHSSPKRGFTLIELLVVIAVIAILVALIMPAVQSARESARRTQCRNNLKQIGIALHNYHESSNCLPFGYVSDVTDPTTGKAWGWAVSILPYLDQGALYKKLSPTTMTLQQVMDSSTHQPYLRTPLTAFYCPSDELELTESHLNRRLTGFTLTASTWPGGTSTLFAGGASAETRRMDSPILTAHVIPWPPPAPPAPGAPPPPPPPPAPGPAGVPVGTSSYVASLGSVWDETTTTWGLTRLRGDGAFGNNTKVTFSDIKDGTSNTFAIGERASDRFAAVWAGVDFWDNCVYSGNQMVLATTAYRLNDFAWGSAFDCRSRGAAGFSSVHTGGAYFLMMDGAVRFVSDTIDSEYTPGIADRKTYQRLSDIADGETIGNF